MKNAIIVGATGFGGLGLIEILKRHNGFTIKQLIARKDTGKAVSDVFPHLKGICDMIIVSSDEIDYNNVDIAFFSTPDRAGMTLIKSFFDKGIKVIDFSGDFRFSSLTDYSAYALNKGIEEIHFTPEILSSAVYGLPELNRKLIKDASIIGNPGCFAISMILGLLPAVSGAIVKNDVIIVDGKTGVSGAGKNSGEANLYPQRHENINTYREGTHQHIIEVSQILNKLGKGKIKILFVPQIVPLNRGILNTIYFEPIKSVDTNDLLKIYQEYYKNEPFVKISENSISTSEVRGSNRCLIKPFIDKNTGRGVIISVIDNLLKGQAGNAVQNANIMCGFHETEGLDIIPFYP